MKSDPEELNTVTYLPLRPRNVGRGRVSEPVSPYIEVPLFVLEPFSRDREHVLRLTVLSALELIEGLTKVVQEKCSRGDIVRVLHNDKPGNYA